MLLTLLAAHGPDSPGGAARQRPDGARATPGRRLLVLLVDDEPLVRRTVSRMLEEEGFSVVDAEHGLAAQELLATSALKPDLVLTDLRMPHLNGAELGHVVKLLRPGVPVLYMSGFGSETSEWLTRDALDRNYIAKPFSREELLESVKRCLHQSPPATH